MSFLPGIPSGHFGARFFIFTLADGTERFPIQFLIFERCRAVDGIHRANYCVSNIALVQALTLDWCVGLVSLNSLFGAVAPSRGNLHSSRRDVFTSLDGATTLKNRFWQAKERILRRPKIC